MTLRQRVKQVELDAGVRHGDLTTEETEEIRQLRREIRALRQEREILRKSNCCLRQGDRAAPAVRFAFVERENAHHSVVILCLVMGVSTSGYSAWRARALAARTEADAELTEQIEQVHRESQGISGAPRVHAELRARGIRCSHNWVARLMRGAGIVGCHRRRSPCTTKRTPSLPPVVNRLHHRFVAAAPNQLWTADITYVSTWAGFLYLAVVLDVFSRRIVGWAMAEHLRVPSWC